MVGVIIAARDFPKVRNVSIIGTTKAAVRVADYTVSMKLNDDAATAGNTKTFRLSDNATLAVTNDRDTIVPTGVFHVTDIMTVVMIAVFCLLIFLFILLRRKYYEGSKA